MSSAPPKILFDAFPIANIGSGIASYARNLLSSFPSNLENSFLVGPKDASFFKDGEKRCHVKSVENRWGKFGRLKFVWPNMVFSQYAQEISIYHGLSNLNLPIFCRKRQIRFVITVHDCIPLLAKDAVSKTYAMQFATLLPKVLAYADAVVAVSKLTKEHLCERFPFAQDKITIIANGQKSWDACNFSFVSNERPELLYVSRYEPYKNFKLLRDLVTLSGFKARLNVVTCQRGKAYFSKNNEVEIKQEKLRVFSELREEELRALYSKCDLYLHPSLYEGFGLPAIEALNSLTPVIFLEGTALDEYLDKDLCSAMQRNASAAQWLEKIISEKEKKADKDFKNKALLRLRNLYSWKDSAALYENLYNRLM